MGKSIKKSWFGLGTTPGNQLVVNGVRFSDGATATNAYIIKQSGARAYVVQDTAKTHDPEIVFLANATATAGLKPGQCFILATPYGGVARPCHKIQQYRLALFESNGTIGNYRWSSLPAGGVGQADLIATGSIAGAILTLTLGAGGVGYFTAPAVTFTGGGTGARATATVSNGSVTALALTIPGTSYESGTVVIAAPPASVAAIASGASTGGVVNNSVTIVSGGGYYRVAPAVTVVGGNGNATATATIANGLVTAITVTSGGTGYPAVVQFTIAPPPAAIQATATATVSV